ncbi:hypothetical protein [Pararhizobium qamdonense]|nr:hypothetical protein [Pararhizobium qamdonense]
MTKIPKPRRQRGLSAHGNFEGAKRFAASASDDERAKREAKTA